MYQINTCNHEFIDYGRLFEIQRWLERDHLLWLSKEELESIISKVGYRNNDILVEANNLVIDRIKRSRKEMIF